MHAIQKQKSPIGFIFDTVFGETATNFWLQKINPLWSMQQALGQIVEKKEIANQTVSLIIKTNRHFNAGQAGQHHPVIVECHGRRYERTYSLTQLDQQHVQLTVKKITQGIVSQWLCDDAKVGDLIEFGQPYGDMTINSTVMKLLSKPLVLIAAGSGITPMYSLLKQLIESQDIQQQPVTLLYWVKTYQDVAFQKDLEQFDSNYPHLNLHIFYTQEACADERINSQHVKLIDDIEQSTVYACGPSDFVNSAQSIFAHAHVFKSEAFSLSPIESDDTGFINVTLIKSNKTIAIPKGQSILVGLEQQNIRAEHGCRMGVCNKCVCHKTQGATKNLVNGMENNEPGHPLKICVNSAKSDLVLDL